MRVAHINSVSYGSTGQIMLGQHQACLSRGDESWAMWGRGREAQDEHEFKYGTTLGTYLDVAQTRVDGRAGLHSRAATRRLLDKLDGIDPELVCLHNLHGYHLNVEMLFEWLAAHECAVRWTLHDCWAFTGHCAHFTYVGCEAWKTGCPASGGCPQTDQYPKTRTGAHVAENYKRKMAAFTSVDSSRMTLATPSEWLAKLTRESYLSGYRVEVVPNKIDHDVFKPTLSDIRAELGLEGKYVILGVASPWTERKGLGDFARLRQALDERFAIVLVGLSRRQVKEVPKGVIGLPRTSSRIELAQLYSAADVLFNPSCEETYPTVNLEAQACGTPVIAYDVSGQPETLSDEKSMAVSGFDEAVLVFERAAG